MIIFIIMIILLHELYQAVPLLYAYSLVAYNLAIERYVAQQFFIVGPSSTKVPSRNMIAVS